MREFGAEVVRAAAADVVGRGIVVLVAAVIGLLAVKGGTVPMWSLAVAVVATVAVTSLVLWRRLAASSSLAAELERDREYASHLQNALDALQRVISGDVDAALPYYVEQGVLAPARDLLTAKPVENVRLSVLWPSPDASDRWTMGWASGHTMTGQLKYREKIGETLARHAFERGEPQYWSDVETQADFRPNPRASAPTRSMVSLPIRHGEEVVAVFNGVSADREAFDPVERTFLAALAGVIAVALGVWREEAAGSGGGPTGRGTSLDNEP